MKSAAAFITTAAFVASVATAPTPESELVARQSPHLKGTIQLYARKPGNTTQIGCINRKGNFITNEYYCAILSAHPTTQNNGEDAIISGNYNCTIGSGPLDGAIFTCNDPTSTNYGQFWNRDNYLSVDGPTGIAYSINSPAPDPEDTEGVPLIIGGSGTWGQFVLLVKNVSG